MPAPHIAPGVTTSRSYTIKGQRSRWLYPHERLDPESTQTLTNINLSERGAAEVRKGYTTYNSTQLSGGEAVTGLIQANWKGTGLKQLVVTPTKVYIDDGTTRTNVTGSLSLTAGGNEDRIRWAFIRDKVVATNGKDETWTKDGTFGGSPSNAAALTGMPWTTCEDLIEHQGLLVAFAPTESGTKYPTRLRWSDINSRTWVPDITSWPDDNRYELYEGSAAIVGAVDNFGLVMCFKEDGLYPGKIGSQGKLGFLEFVPSTPIRGFSPIEKHSIIARPEFVFGVAREGAFIIDRELNVHIITLDIMDEWKALNETRLKYAMSFIREEDHQIRTILSGTGNSTEHDLVLVYDWETQDVWFDKPVDAMNACARLVVDDVEYDWLGDASGFIYRGNTGTTDNGDGFAWEIRTAPNDLGAPGRTKTIHYVRTIMAAQDGQQSIDMSVFRDQGALEPRRKTIKLFTGNTFNSGKTYNRGTKYPAAANSIDRFFVNRSAETIDIRWKGNAPASIRGYQVEFVVEE